MPSDSWHKGLLWSRGSLEAVGFAHCHRKKGSAYETVQSQLNRVTIMYKVSPKTLYFVVEGRNRVTVMYKVSSKNLYCVVKGNS